MLTRRQFLSRSAAGVSCLSLGGLMPGLFVRAADEARKDANDHILVVVELAGGNDGLNTVIPHENDLYHKARPKLRIPKDKVLKLSDAVGLHPALAPAGELFEAGKLAVVQGAGYPQPDRSHFRSMEIWHTASTAARAPAAGWLGRILDQQPLKEDDLPGLALAGSLPQAFLAEKVSVPVVQQLDAFADAAEKSPKSELLRKLSTAPATQTEPLGFLRRQSATLYRTAARLHDAEQKYRSEVQYPGDLGQQLRRAAQVITAGLGVRLFFTSQGGYDTHNQQANQHQNLLAELAGALTAFQKDLEQHKVADRVLVVAFSEFGRRVAENASLGTDHGAASCMFLAGSRVKGGLAGRYPSLEKLDDGDLVHTVDFRSVYATLLEKWLGCEAEKVLGQKFPLLELVRA
jgi:uncharacterized protein (DUF1501 family)